MQNATFMDKMKKRLGMKTSEEKVDDGLRVMRDLLDRIGEHDIAMTVDEMILMGSIGGKCMMSLTLGLEIKRLLLSKKIEEIIREANETD